MKLPQGTEWLQGWKTYAGALLILMVVANHRWHWLPPGDEQLIWEFAVGLGLVGLRAALGRTQATAKKAEVAAVKAEAAATSAEVAAVSAEATVVAADPNAERLGKAGPLDA